MKIIKTSEALPKSGRYVLAWLEGAKIPMRAMWAAQHTLPLGDDADPEWGEYSEEKDEYFCPAGWYEMNQHEEQHWGVSGNVVAWCELPRLEAGAAPAAVAGPAIDRAATLAAIDDISEPSWTGYECPNTWADGLSAARAVVQSAPAAPALEAPAAPARIVADALIRLDAIYREEADCDEPPQRPDWLATALRLAAAAPQAPNCTRCSGSGEDPEGYLTHGHGPDDHTVDGPCRSCDGTGAAPQAPAAPSIEAELMQALRDLVNALRERHYGRMPEEVQAAYDKAWAIVFAAPAAAPAAPDDVLCYIRAAATLPERHGFEVCRATDAGAMAVMGDGRAHAMPTVTPAEFAADIDQLLAEPAAPAVDAETIHLQDLKNALAECRELRQQVRLMDEQQAGSVWRWQADGRDQLETMGNHMGVLIRACDLRALVAGAAPAVDAPGERDAAFEAVRNRLCGMQRYSFVLDNDGVVRRAQDRTGSWIEFDDAHALFDPEAVDAALAAQAKEGGE